MLLRLGRLARPIASRVERGSAQIFKRTLSGSLVLRREDPPANLRSSFARAGPPPNLKSNFPPPQPELPVPGWFRYSPWSDRFQGSLKTRILLQTLFYAFLIAQVSNYVDAALFVRSGISGTTG
jgi:hypothetical protein